MGRSSACDIRLPFRVVSGHHLTLAYSDSTLRVCDEHTTNGTRLDGKEMTSGQMHRVVASATVDIVDLRIGVEIIPQLADGISLSQTGAMTRQMLGAALLNSPADGGELDAAYLEVVNGPAAGQTRSVPEAVDHIRLASDDAADLMVPTLTVSLELYRDGDGFAVCTPDDGDRPVLVEGTPIGDGRRLHSGDIIAAGDLELCFCDPLECHLAELDYPDRPATDERGRDPDDISSELSIHDPRTDQTDPTDTPVRDTQNPDPPSGRWDPLRIGVIIVSIAVIAGVIALFLWVFGVFAPP